MTGLKKTMRNILMLCTLAALGTASCVGGDVSPIPSSKVVELTSKLPLSFEANRGQTDAQVKFLSRGPGYNLYLGPTETVLSLHRVQRMQGPDGGSKSAPQTTLRMKLVGGNPSSVTGLDLLPGKFGDLWSSVSVPPCALHISGR